MKTSFLLTLLTALAYFYLRNSPPTTKTVTAPSTSTVRTQGVIVVAAQSSYNRWKTGPNAQTDLQTGPNAQTDLKTGPNAQTDFEPFAPNVQATWNQTPGYTIVSGANLRVR